MKGNIKKTASAGLLSSAIVVGLAGFASASSGTIGTTGPYSYNSVRHGSSTKVDVDNDNNLHLSNRSDQHASSGKADVRLNTTGGDARTGSATNANGTSASVTLDNSSSSAAALSKATASTSDTGSINNTGAYSTNRVTFDSRSRVEVKNDNRVSVHNNTDQSARSGDAVVQQNTTGGSAVTGNTSNTNSSSFTIQIKN